MKNLILALFIVFNLVQVSFADTLYQRAEAVFIGSTYLNEDIFLVSVFKNKKNIEKSFRFTCVNSTHSESDYSLQMEFKGTEDIVSKYYISYRLPDLVSPSAWNALKINNDGEFGTEPPATRERLFFRTYEKDKKNYIISQMQTVDKKIYCWSTEL